MAANKTKKKTHKGAAKRFKVTGTGKVVHKKANSGHLMSSKRSKRRRGFRQDGTVEGRTADTIKDQLSAS